VLRDGLVEQAGKPLELYDDPANKFVAGFIGSPKMNLLEAEVVEAAGKAVTLRLVHQGNAQLRLPLTGPLPAAGSTVTLGIRPEHFVEAGAGDIDLPLSLDVVEHLGSTSFVYANTGA